MSPKIRFLDKQHYPSLNNVAVVNLVPMAALFRLLWDPFQYNGSGAARVMGVVLASRVGEGLTRESCRGFIPVNYILAYILLEPESHYNCN